MIAYAPYAGVLGGIFMVAVYMHLWRSRTPAAASSWRGQWVAMGDCPKEHCGGSTFMVAAESCSTLWRCNECKTGYILSTIPGE